jgi:hypothetical protein
MISMLDHVPTYSLKRRNSQHNDPCTDKEFTIERNDQKIILLTQTTENKRDDQLVTTMYLQTAYVNSIPRLFSNNINS